MKEEKQNGLVISSDSYIATRIIPEKKSKLDLQNNTYTIRTLVDLDKIDAKLLSKLERISLELPNCELINEQATVEVNKILESYDNIYTLRKLYHEMGDLIAVMTFFTMGLAIPVIGIISAYCGIYNMVVKQKIKKKSYEEFCRLREKIIAIYKMPANYRSYPALEQKLEIKI